MQGKATFRGHSLHLILVSFPVGFWTGTLATDAAGAFTHDPFWFRMSVVLIGGGVVIGALASLAGYIDYRTVTMTLRARSLATAHLQWSLATLAFFAIAWRLRAGDPAAPGGITVTVLGALLLLVGAYLGSELAARYHVGVREREETT